MPMIVFLQTGSFLIHQNDPYYRVIITLPTAYKWRNEIFFPVAPSERGEKKWTMSRLSKIAQEVHRLPPSTRPLDNSTTRPLDHSTSPFCPFWKFINHYSHASPLPGNGKFNYLVLLTLLPVCWANFYASTSISYVLPSAECELQLSMLDKGLLNSMSFAGKRHVLTRHCLRCVLSRYCKVCRRDF
jgi:hypothetical protein